MVLNNVAISIQSAKQEVFINQWHILSQIPLNYYILVSYKSHQHPHANKLNFARSTVTMECINKCSWQFS